ncbi:hypothetical protein BDV93DRAFT_316067 [Ceratobasidium sp. AG-I]|nr:hypothetical protein BDV93DRAFT_316067 [Ceratobasidium sp. AG-I]
MSWLGKLRRRNAEQSAFSAPAPPSPTSSISPLPSVSPPLSDNPVRIAYIASLESQVTSLRDELATSYKTQGHNAQRLLSMNETLREKEEEIRASREGLLPVRRAFNSTDSSRFDTSSSSP